MFSSLLGFLVFQILPVGFSWPTVTNILVCGHCICRGRYPVEKHKDGEIFQEASVHGSRGAGGACVV